MALKKKKTEAKLRTAKTEPLRKEIREKIMDFMTLNLGRMRVASEEDWKDFVIVMVELPDGDWKLALKRKSKVYKKDFLMWYPIPPEVLETSKYKMMMLGMALYLHLVISFRQKKAAQTKAQNYDVQALMTKASHIKYGYLQKSQE